MLTDSCVKSTIRVMIAEILGDLDDDEITDGSALIDIGLNSLMLARLIVGLEQRLGHDPFSSGSCAIVDIHTVGDLVAAYEKEAEGHGD